mmetsp:Transcript_80378/g.247854  ORF Transcript_80378/g.247854 Transcript_80378/m.247854 type:complete len:216 (-) Transcript_80378:275-922(-)
MLLRGREAVAPGPTWRQALLRDGPMGLRGGRREEGARREEGRPASVEAQGLMPPGISDRGRGRLRPHARGGPAPGRHAGRPRPRPDRCAEDGPRRRPRGAASGGRLGRGGGRARRCQEAPAREERGPRAADGPRAREPGRRAGCSGRRRGEGCALRGRGARAPRRPARLASTQPGASRRPTVPPRSSAAGRQQARSLQAPGERREARSRRGAASH